MLRSIRIFQSKNTSFNLRDYIRNTNISIPRLTNPFTIFEIPRPQDSMNPALKKILSHHSISILFSSITSPIPLCEAINAPPITRRPS